MQEIACSTATEFVERLRITHELWGGQPAWDWGFRGQGNADWDLLPSAFRAGTLLELRQLHVQGADSDARAPALVRVQAHSTLPVPRGPGRSLGPRGRAALQAAAHDREALDGRRLAAGRRARNAGHRSAPRRTDTAARHHPQRVDRGVLRRRRRQGSQGRERRGALRRVGGRPVGGPAGGGTARNGRQEAAPDTRHGPAGRQLVPAQAGRLVPARSGSEPWTGGIGPLRDDGRGGGSDLSGDAGGADRQPAPTSAPAPRRRWSRSRRRCRSQWTSSTCSTGTSTTAPASCRTTTTS